MKKLTIGILSAAMILGAAGGFAQAKENGDANGKGLFNFGQMKSQMEEVHPDLSTQDLKEMYDSCDEGSGMMGDENLNMDNFMNDTENMNFNNMMNNF